MAEYIERGLLLDKLENVPWYDNADRDEVAIPAVYEIAAADAAPVVHGYWTWAGCCSVCGSHWADGMVDRGDDWGYFDPMPDYCMYCGAKMDLESVYEI